MFDRGDDYDPRIDSIVRVEAGRLRSKVDEYYSGPGRGDSILIQLRKGSYAPAFESNGHAVTSAAVEEDLQPDARLALAQKLVSGSSSAVLVVVAIAAWRAGMWATRRANASSSDNAVLPFANYSRIQPSRCWQPASPTALPQSWRASASLGVVFTRARCSARTFARDLRSERSPRHSARNCL